jgi:hypothetical protein
MSVWRVLWSSQRARWSLAVWLLGVGLVLFLRFPVKFLLEPPFLMDFEAYRAAAERIVQGHAAELYQPLSSERMIFKYAPCWAILLAPFGWLPSHAGGILWSVINVIGVVWTCWIADRLCRLIGFGVPAFLSVLGLLFVVRPLSAAFLQGQSDILWGMLVSGFLLLAITARPWLAAACLALAISLKLPALLLLMWLFLRQRVRLAAQTLLWLVLFNVPVAWWLVPSNPLGLFRDWTVALAGSGTTYAFDIGNQSFLALMGRLLRADGYRFNVLALPDQQVMLITLAIQALLFTLPLLLIKKRKPETPRFLLEGSIMSVLMVLCSPSVWIATYTALLTPAIIGLAGLIRPIAAPSKRLPQLLTAALLLALSVMTHGKFWKAIGLPFLRNESYVFLVLMILPWLGLTLYGWLVYCSRTFDSSATDTSLPSTQ